MKSINASWVVWPLICLLPLIIVGCGGKSNNRATVPTNENRETTAHYGSLTTRVVGTAQPPVTASASGATVTGVAGAVITAVTETITSPLTLEKDTRIVFASTMNDGYGGSTFFNIYSMKPDGSDRKRLTRSSFDDTWPVFSPDGTRIAFTSTRTADHDIYTMNVDGSGLARKTTSIGYDTTPSYSPDGTKIAFASNRNGNFEIYTIPVSGSDPANVTQLTATPADDSKPVWSPDGTRIAFHSGRTGNQEIFIMNADGTNVINLTNLPASIETEPSFSPDGKLIVFRARGLRGQDSEIFIVNVDGSNIRAVGVDNSDEDLHAYFAPTGDRIVYISDRDGNREVYTSDLSGENKVRLTNNGAEEITPSWSGYRKPTPRKLIGTGAVLATAAAGFFVSQTGDEVKAVVAFDTGVATLDSRSAARITAQSGTGNVSPSNLVFIITSPDGLTSLRYINGSAAATTVIGSGGDVSNASAAIVSFNAMTGTVSLVVPYVADRAVGEKLPMETSGDVLTYRGRFPAVYHDGKNVAPNGASVVRINAHTGALIDVQ